MENRVEEWKVRRGSSKSSPEGSAAESVRGRNDDEVDEQETRKEEVEEKEK